MNFNAKDADGRRQVVERLLQEWERSPALRLGELISRVVDYYPHQCLERIGDWELVDEIGAQNDSLERGGKLIARATPPEET